MGSNRTEQELRAQGDKVRREVLGDARVDELCAVLLRDPASVSGLQLGLQDRYHALSALIATGADEPWEAMTAAPESADAEKYAFLAGAARADAETKRRYFSTYMQLDKPPEQWMQQSLAYFHWPEQGALTLPYLRQALDRVEWVKQNRRIFFMPAWIDAFINARDSAPSSVGS